MLMRADGDLYHSVGVGGPPFNLLGGVEMGVFLSRQIIYFNPARRPAENFALITCLYRTVIKVNYLFHAEYAPNYLFQNAPPPHRRLKGGPLRPSIPEAFTQCGSMLVQRLQRWPNIVPALGDPALGDSGLGVPSGYDQTATGCRRASQWLGNGHTGTWQVLHEPFWWMAALFK